MIKINCKALLGKIFELQGKYINLCECLGCAAGQQKGHIYLFIFIFLNFHLFLLVGG